MSPTIIKLDELIKCKEDIVYFINKYVQLDSSTFILNSPQIEIIKSIQDNPKTICRYPRRFGKTILMMGISLHQALFEKKKIVYYSYNMAQRIQFLRGISALYHALPKWMKCINDCIENYNKIEIGKGSVRLIDDYKMQGMTSDLLILDEIDKLNVNIIKSFFATLNKIIIIGTYKTIDPVIGELWLDARQNDVGWKSLPSKDEEWKVDIIASLLSNSKYQQNY